MFVYSTHDKDASDPVYSLEALISATSLRRHTNLPIRLVTNNTDFLDRVRALDYNPFTDLVAAGADTPPKLQKIEALRGMADQDAVFVDSDTVILDDISRVFDFGMFDIAAVQAIWREGITSIERAVEREQRRRFMLNSGLLFVRRNTVEPLATAWAKEYRTAFGQFGPAAADQPSLEQALALLNPEVFQLPVNYNFRTNFGGILSGKCFVVHGHFRSVARELGRQGLGVAQIDHFLARIEMINANSKTRMYRKTNDISQTRFKPL
ncbi:hypothetical protein ROJ8625_01555 [Roseivivax jejudonensis]|uniref:Nucleotide-diphospho-sugar transferase n=1 Tax=Roseivivax jejudonensis TaxID=1529041 RepID=A0A1X6YWD8_9RHOB|nr:hypothetical protein [Roseivivax jejudonensis]SLN33228.1 hypothetical protein ROJ8625_01555 [Roseivivax jejudonensis]